MLKRLLPALGLLVATSLFAQQYAPAPTQYTIKSVNADQTQIIYRDGNTAVIDLLTPKTADHPEIHMKTVVDVPTNRTLSWDLNDPKIPCNVVGTGSSWGDPFHWYQDMVDMTGGVTPKQVGKEQVKSWPTTVFASSSPDGSAKFWRENKYGLLVKAEMAPKGQETVQMVGLDEFKIGKPDPAAMKVPARCAWPPK